MLPQRVTRLSVVVLLALLAGLPMLSSRPAAAAETADLAVSTSAAKHIRFGDTAGITTTVTNHGPGTATGVTLGLGVSDSLADFGGTCPDGSVSNFCQLPTLAAGEAVTVTFFVMACCTCCPTRLGVAVASVTHDANVVDPVGVNDSVRLEIRLTGPAPF